MVVFADGYVAAGFLCRTDTLVSLWYLGAFKRGSHATNTSIFAWEYEAPTTVFESGILDDAWLWDTDLAFQNGELFLLHRPN